MNVVALSYRAVVLAYNLPTISDLVLSRDDIVAMYNGTLQFWNDSRLGELNPNVTFPNNSIKVIWYIPYTATVCC